MNKASPVQLREAIGIANAMVEAGIAFVPIPVFDDADTAVQFREMQHRLQLIEQDVEAEQQGH